MYIAHTTSGNEPFAQDPHFGQRGLLRVQEESTGSVHTDADGMEVDAEAEVLPYVPYGEHEDDIAVPAARKGAQGNAPWIMFTPLEWTVPCRGRFHLYFELDPTAPGGAIRIGRLEYLDQGLRKGNR